MKENINASKIELSLAPTYWFYLNQTHTRDLWCEKKYNSPLEALPLVWIVRKKWKKLDVRKKKKKRKEIKILNIWSLYIRLERKRILNSIIFTLSFPYIFNWKMVVKRFFCNEKQYFFLNLFLKPNKRHFFLSLTIQTN